MGIIGVLALVAINAGLLYLVIYFVVGPKPEIWRELFLLALFITFISVLRNLLHLFPNADGMQLLARVVVAVLVGVMVYGYCHFRLGMERLREKLLIATIYPGIKLVLGLLLTTARG